jgi:hypothetical protein
MSDVLAYAVKIIAQFLKPELEAPFNITPNEFDSVEDVLKLYEGGIELPKGLLETIRENIPIETLKEIFKVMYIFVTCIAINIEDLEMFFLCLLFSSYLNFILVMVWSRG